MFKSVSSSNFVPSVVESISKSVTQCDHVNIWHMRLGHPNFNVLCQVLKVVPTIPHIQNNKIDFCAACKFGKMHQFHFPSSLHKTKRPFEIVHSDLWGPSPHISTEGYKYYIHFVDDFTRFTWIFPLKVKSEAYSKVIQFQTFVERQFEYKIKCLQTDWGGEYRSLVPFLQNLGIHFRHPCPHTHQQNGKAERKHQHIAEMGLTLLAQAKLPLKFWWDSFATAVHLINRLPT